jgi:hypothetical protein
MRGQMMQFARLKERTGMGLVWKLESMRVPRVCWYGTRVYGTPGSMEGYSELAASIKS